MHSRADPGRNGREPDDVFTDCSLYFERRRIRCNWRHRLLLRVHHGRACTETVPYFPISMSSPIIRLSLNGHVIYVCMVLKIEGPHSRPSIYINNAESSLVVVVYVTL